jgi:hypothetical protein
MIRPRMRTTLDIDDDVLQAAKEIGAMRGKTAGQIISEYARKALAPRQKFSVRNGVPIIHRGPGARLITTADVKRWQDEDEMGM